MNWKNSENLMRCTNCNALFDKTVKWARGYYEGTSDYFTQVATVKENSCPICGKSIDKC